MKEFGRKLALVVALALFVLQLGIYFVPFSDGAAVAELAALDAATMVVLGALSRLVQRRIARRAGSWSSRVAGRFANLYALDSRFLNVELRAFGNR